MFKAASPRDLQALAIERVSKAFGKRVVLRELSLQVASGEYVGLVGCNGAGKTTLFKCIFDFCDLDAGSIALFGQDHRRSSARQGLAYLPERYRCPPLLTGYEFLHHMARLHGQPLISERLQRVVTAVDLPVEVLQRQSWKLSKGTSQKLGLAATLLSDKPLLILDEPMSGLDPKARVRLKEYLCSRKRLGQTVLFSTHLLVDVDTLCDRVAIIHGGRICFFGTPEACRTQFETDSLEQAFLRCIAAGAAGTRSA